MVTFQYKEAILSKSSKTLLDNYIKGYGLNPNEVQIDFAHVMDTNMRYIDDEFLIMTNAQKIDTGRIDTINSNYYTRYKGFSIKLYFPEVDTRFFKFKGVNKESVDILKEEINQKTYPYGEYSKIWILNMTESKIDSLNIVDEGAKFKIMGANEKEQAKNIIFDKKY